MCRVVDCWLLCSVDLLFLVFVCHRVVGTDVLWGALGTFGEVKALLAGGVLVWVLDVQPTTLSDNVEVLSCLQDLLLVFCEEDWDHFLPVCEPLDPVLIIKVDFDVLLKAALVFANDELLERVLKDTAENPLLQNVKVR